MVNPSLTCYAETLSGLTIYAATVVLGRSN